MNRAQPRIVAAGHVVRRVVEEADAGRILENDRAIVRALPAVPRSVVQRISSRYIAGPSLDDAVRIVRELNAEGRLATIDVLGEEIRSADEAAAIARAYRDVLARIDEEGLTSNISVKPTALGLELGYEVCRANFEDVVADARERGAFVRMPHLRGS